MRKTKAVEKTEVVEEQGGVRLAGQDGAGEGWCPLEPVLGTMVLEALEGAKTTKGGLHLPAQYSASMGIFGLYRVRSLGPGKVLDNGVVLEGFLSVGDVLLVAKADVAEWTWLGHKFYLCQVDQTWTKVRVAK